MAGYLRRRPADTAVMLAVVAAWDEGKTGVQIAAELGLGLNRVTWMINRARRLGYTVARRATQ